MPTCLWKLTAIGDIGSSHYPRAKAEPPRKEKIWERVPSPRPLIPIWLERAWLLVQWMVKKSAEVPHQEVLLKSHLLRCQGKPSQEISEFQNSLQSHQGGGNGSHMCTEASHCWNSLENCILKSQEHVGKCWASGGDIPSSSRVTPVPSDKV